MQVRQTGHLNLTQSRRLRHPPATPPAEARIWGTASILGGVRIVRVHDVAEMTQVAHVADCLLDPRLSPRNP